MRYFSHTADDIKNMLQTIGKQSVEALFDSIPKEARVRNMPQWRAKSEPELMRALEVLASDRPKVSFLGAGATRHFVPQMVSQQLLRSEWYTAYTPYQPEIAQGTLQAIFEFQTMVASLFGCDVANASMYDGATALAESLLMAARIKHGKRTFLLSKAIHPEYRAVCESFLKPAGLTVVEVDFDEAGRTNANQLKDLLANNNDVAAVAFQTPNFLGNLENQKELIELTQNCGALAIAANTEPLAFATHEPPGADGADMVVGEGIGFCGHLSLGAPGVGLFACKKAYVRQMPGRLVGQSTDSAGKRAFVLTLATREQHIRRERATSNICTNHSLMALAFSISLALYGKKGFVGLAKTNTAKLNQVKASSLKLKFNTNNFNELVLEFETESILDEKVSALHKKNIFPGVKLGKWYPEFSNCLLVSTTELHTDNDIDNLIQALEG